MKKWTGLLPRGKSWAFHAFTNVTLVDDAFCEKMREAGNLSLSISPEGFAEVNDLRRGEGVFEQVMEAMDTLKRHGQIFGTSICYTSKNVETVTSDEFLDMIIKKDAGLHGIFITCQLEMRQFRS